MSYRIHRRYRVIVMSTSSREKKKSKQENSKKSKFLYLSSLSSSSFSGLPLSRSFLPLGGSNTITRLCAACTDRLCACVDVRERVCVRAVCRCESQGEGAIGTHTASRPGSWDRKLCRCPNQRLKAPIAAHEY